MFEITEEQEIENAKSNRDILHIEKMTSQSRCSELADEFTRLEVQVAAILVAFAGAFPKFFGSEYVALSPVAILITKSMYALSVFLLILSGLSVLFLPLLTFLYLYPSIDVLLLQNAELHAKRIATHF